MPPDRLLQGPDHSVPPAEVVEPRGVRCRPGNPGGWGDLLALEALRRPLAVPPLDSLPE